MRKPEFFTRFHSKVTSYFKSYIGIHNSADILRALNSWSGTQVKLGNTIFEQALLGLV